MNLKYCSDNHSKHLILLHIIFVCKYRKKLLVRNDVKEDVELYAYEICNKWNVEIIQMNTDKDHIHFMLRIKPTTVINKLVAVMKQYITFHIWQKYSKYLKQYLWKEHTFFTDGYFVSSIGNVSADKLNTYIEEQGEMNYQREYRIYPNKRQREIIAKTFGVTRFIYNEMLAMKVEHYKKTKDSLAVKPSDVRSNHAEYKWLFDKDLDGTAIANTWNLLSTAYKNFFQQYKKNGHGFPKFKKKKSRQSYTIRQTIKFVDDNHLSIPKCGKLKCVGDKVEGKIKSCCIKQMPSGKYFATILYEIPEPVKLEPNQFQVGIDLGLKEFAICSDGEVIANPRNTKKYADKLAWKQRLLSRKTKGSNRRNKARIQVAEVHEKISNSRKDFQQKLSTRLINENQVICLETLKASNMLKNHSLAKAIADASWSSFVSMLKYKAEWYGRSIVKISPYYPSSQLCSHCGHKFTGTKDLGVRVWECPECHNVNERDLNASINILKEGLRKYNLRSGGPITHGDTGCNSNLDRECGNL